jgi:hypothetical protein
MRALNPVPAEGGALNLLPAEDSRALNPAPVDMTEFWTLFLLEMTEMTLLLLKMVDSGPFSC